MELQWLVNSLSMGLMTLVIARCHDVAEMVSAGTCVRAFSRPTCLISIVSDAENRLIKVEIRSDTPQA